MAAERSSQGRRADAVAKKESPEILAVKTALFKDAYEEGKRTVTAQLAQLDSMRNRSLQFLAFVGASTGFLVGAGLTNVDKADRTVLYTIAAIGATLALVMAVASIIGVLVGVVRIKDAEATNQNPAGIHIANWGRRDKPGWLVNYIQQEDPVTPEWKYYWARAESYEKKRLVNQPLLAKVRRLYLFSLISGAVALIGWATIVWVFV